MTDNRLPGDLAAERTVLATAVVDREVLGTVIATGLQPEHFLAPAHGAAWRAVLALWERRESVDEIALAHELAATGDLEELGGHAYIGKIVAELPTTLGAAHAAGLVQRDAAYRQLIEAGSAIVQQGYQGGADPLSVFDAAEALVREARPVDGGRPTRETVLENIVVELSQALGGDVEYGTLSGFPTLDQITGGWHRGRLIVVAAYTSVGKSAFAIQTARKVAETGKRVLYFTLEESERDIWDRAAQAISGINIAAHRRPGATMSDSVHAAYQDAIMKFYRLPFTVIDEAGLTPQRVRALTAVERAKGPLDLVVVDHLHLMRGPEHSRRDRVRELGEIANSLKELAKEFDVPVLLPAQINRAASKDNRPPELSDLRGSGEIEAAGDQILFLHVADAQVVSGAYLQRVEVRVEKNRRGARSLSVDVWFEPSTQRFYSSLEAADPQPEQPELIGEDAAG